MMRTTTATLLLLLPTTSFGFAGLGGKQPQQQQQQQQLQPKFNSRRELLTNIAGAVVATTVLAPNAFAMPTDETPKITTRMGGLLEKYQDGVRGLTVLAPSGWNKFEGEVGAYDVKWQDLVDPRCNIKISSTPVKSTTTSIDVLGDVQVLGENLASKRNAKLLSAEERLTDNILFYTFDFAINDGTHQLLQLCVNKGKIWSLDANSSEKRWGKLGPLYKNVAGSFMPKLS